MGPARSRAAATVPGFVRGEVLAQEKQETQETQETPASVSEG
ncbi:hypothetical protein [Streptomyces sp. NPDC045251]